MNNGASVELTVRYGAYGQKVKTVAVPINEDITRELMEPVEWSEEPLSLMLASPGMYGGKGDARTMREKTFKMRREVANQIARAMASELLKAFGVNDELDGYRIDQMSEQQRAYHAMRGRLYTQTQEQP